MYVAVNSPQTQLHMYVPIQHIISNLLREFETTDGDYMHNVLMFLVYVPLLHSNS